MLDRGMSLLFNMLRWAALALRLQEAVSDLLYSKQFFPFMR